MLIVNTKFIVAEDRITTKYEKKNMLLNKNMLDIISVRRATHRHNNAGKIKK